MFIYVLSTKMSSPNTGGTHKITSPGSLAHENLTRTFNCTRYQQLTSGLLVIRDSALQWLGVSHRAFKLL
jgi:hypothetical protein